MAQQLESRTPVRSRRKSRESSEHLREASDALRQASGWFVGMSWLYRIGAMAYGVATAFAIVALARNEVPLEGGILVVCLTTLLTVLNLMGAMHLHFYPFAWNLVIALLATGVVVVHALGPNPLGIALPLNLVFATVLWCALVPTYQLKRLIDQHKDLYILHHAGANTRRSLRGRTAEEKHERLVDAMRRASIRTWEWSGVVAIGIVAASAAATYFVVHNNRPEELDAALGRFESAWEQSDVEAVGALYDPRIRESEAGWLARRTAGLGWGAALPALGDGHRHEEEDGVHVDYAAASAPVATRWIMNGTKWNLAKIELPLPAFEPELEAFLDAFERSDGRAIASFFPEESRVEMQQVVQESVELLEWDAFPKVVETTVSETDGGDKYVTLEFERRRLRTRWHLRNGGEWRLHYLKFPNRSVRRSGEE